MNNGEKTLFARRLSFLIRAQVPLLEALTIVSKQARTKNRRQMFERILRDVASGQFLSASLMQFRKTFGDFAIDIIRVGEESGMLDENLNYLADELQKRHELQRKVISALIYPIFITVATLSVIILITTYIFPKIIPVFTTMHAALPISTRILMAISSLLVHHGLALTVLTCALAAALVIAFRKSMWFRMTSHATSLKIPIFGRLLRNYYLANFCRTCGLLLNSHFPIVRAAQVTADTTGNLIYRRELTHMAEEISRGRRVAASLERRPDLFPNMVAEMVAIGEKTGNLSGTLLYLAGYYETEMEAMTKNLSSSIEPVLMVAMGAIVGFVAISVITPIYAITQNLHH